MENFSEILYWYIAFLFSTTCHEAAHAFTAYKMGDSTAYDAGQVSLNPLPHIKREPFGMVIVPLITFFMGGWLLGWGSAPYNPEWAYNNPKKSAAMAAAGPMMNFVLLFSMGLLIHLGIFLGVFQAPESITISSLVEAINPGVYTAIAKIISIMFSLNLILFVFNLIPIPPLDGSGILPMYMNEERGRKYLEAVRNPAFTFIGIFIAWKLFDVIYLKLHLIFINLLYFGAEYR